MKKSVLFLAMLVALCADSALAQARGSFDDCFRRICDFTATGQRFRITSKAAEGTVKSKVLPALPRGFTKDGYVRVRILIDKEGSVACAMGVEGDPDLYEISEDAARKWRFKPYTLHKEAVCVESSVVFHFRHDKVEVKFE